MKTFGDSWAKFLIDEEDTYWMRVEGARLELDNELSAPANAGRVLGKIIRKKVAGVLSEVKSCVQRMFDWCDDHQERGNEASTTFTEQREADVSDRVNRMVDGIVKKFGESVRPLCDLRRRNLLGHVVRAFQDGRRKFRPTASQPATSAMPCKRRYMKKADADRIANENFNELWRIGNKTRWATAIGCSRDIVGSLNTWSRAERRRNGWKKAAVKLTGLVDPLIIAALNSHDASLLGSLSVGELDHLDSLPDDARQEVLELLQESARDAESENPQQSARIVKRRD